MSNGIRKARNFAALSGGALVVAPFVAVGTAEAGTYTVSNTNDSGAGSLRKAIEDANANPDADVITFTAAAHGTITLESELSIEGSVDIQGPGADLLTIDGNGHRIFYIYNIDTTIDVTISHVTMSGAESTNRGGAVTLWGEHLTLDSVVISNNTTTDQGGGVYASNDSDAEIDDLALVVRNSTISDNEADQAGGGVVVYGASLTEPAVLIENSTISGNVASRSGGGMGLWGGLSSPITVRSSTISGNVGSVGGGVFVYGSVVLEHSTITGNTAVGSVLTGGGSVAGYSATGGGVGGIYASIDLDHTVVSGNTAAEGADIGVVFGAEFTGSYSMVGDLDGVTLGGTNNLAEGDAKLGALADNGGATETHLPQAGSPLINAGDAAFAPPPSTDQRGLARVAGGRIDIGAVEVQPAALPPTGGSNGLMAGLGAALLGLGGALHLTGRRKRSA